MHNPNSGDSSDNSPRRRRQTAWPASGGKLWGIASFPPHVRWRFFTFCGLIVATSVGGGLALIIDIFWQDRWSWFILGGMVAVNMAVSVWIFVTIIRLIRRARAHDDLLCVYCGYAVEGLDETGTCPECGKTYSFDECRRLWRAFKGAGWRRGSTR